MIPQERMEENEDESIFCRSKSYIQSNRLVNYVKGVANKIKI